MWEIKKLIIVLVGRFGVWLLSCFFCVYLSLIQVAGRHVFYSNGSSTWKQSEGRGCAPGLRDPHWALFDAWIFPGVSLGDIRGVCEVTKAGDAVYLGQVGQVLDGLCHNWRLMYPQQ